MSSPEPAGAVLVDGTRRRLDRQGSAPAPRRTAAVQPGRTTDPVAVGRWR